MSIVYIIIMFFACMILYKSGSKFFLCWLAICAAVFFFLSSSAGVWGLLIYVYMWSHDGYTEEDFKSGKAERRSVDSSVSGNKIYADGTRRIEKISETGYYYSNGEESWVSMLDVEHRSNGEDVYDNAFLSGRRDIYNEKNEYIGYEYEDSVGVTHRVEKNS